MTSRVFAWKSVRSSNRLDIPRKSVARQKAIIVTIDDIDARDTTYISFLPPEHSPLHFSFSEKSIEMLASSALDAHSRETVQISAAARVNANSQADDNQLTPRFSSARNESRFCL